MSGKRRKRVKAISPDYRSHRRTQLHHLKLDHARVLVGERRRLLGGQRPRSERRHERRVELLDTGERHIAVDDAEMRVEVQQVGPGAINHFNFALQVEEIGS